MAQNYTDEEAREFGWRVVIAVILATATALMVILVLTDRAPARPLPRGTCLTPVAGQTFQSSRNRYAWPRTVTKVVGEDVFYYRTEPDGLREYTRGWLRGQWREWCERERPFQHGVSPLRGGP